MELTYQQKVLLAAYEISKESDGKREYEFSVNGDEMFVVPITILDDKRRKFKNMRVTDKTIFRDEFFVNELERKLKEMF